MNLADTSDLLTFIARFDNRRVDDATVLAWHPVLQDLTLADCQRAVAEHFGDSDVYLMPVHIRRRVAELQRERVRLERQHAELAAIAAEAAVPRGTLRDRSTDVQALVAQARVDMPDGDPEALRPRAAYWEREHRAHQRQAGGVPNPDYDPSLRPVPEWSAASRAPEGCWWQDETARERHARTLLAAAGRLRPRESS